MPPVRRLYHHALHGDEVAAELKAHIDRLSSELEAAVQRRETLEQQLDAVRSDGTVAELEARADRLSSELGIAVQERESLELRLYTLRSEHQRTVSRNEELVAALHAREDIESQLEISRQAHLRAVDQGAELSAALAQSQAELERTRASPLLMQDLELVYAKLSARLTLLAGEIAAMRTGSLVGTAGSPGNSRVITAYLDLLERALTGELTHDAAISPWSTAYDRETRLIGRDWPATAQTMIGLARMRNIRTLTEQVLADRVPGDLLEAGVWRGGACIYMRGILAAHGVDSRSVWVADSFQGLPEPEPASTPPTRRIRTIRSRSFGYRLTKSAKTLNATACSIARSDFCRDGSRIRCPQPPSNGLRCCGWTVICIHRPFKRWKLCITRCRREASSS